MNDDEENFDKEEITKEESSEEESSEEENKGGITKEEIPAEGLSANFSRAVNYLELPLFRAIREWDLNKVREIVENGIDINQREGEALRLACRYKQIPIVKYLVENGADVNLHPENEGSPLNDAVGTGLHEMVKYLVENGANVNDNDAFRTAISYEDLKMVEYLVGRGVIPSENNFFFSLIIKSFKITKYLIEEHGMDIEKMTADLEPKFSDYLIRILRDE